MSSVMTLQGPVSAEDLGIVDYHEHLCYDAPAWLLREDPDFSLNNPELSARELRDWVAAGGKTIVEMSAIDFGRNVRKVLQIAEKVPEAFIIVITGFNKPYYCDEAVWKTDEKELIKKCIQDIEKGIDGTEAKAGVVKGGTGYNTFNERDQKLLRIAAQVHLATGVPIITHTEAGTMALEQVEYLCSFGVAPHRICLSHMDRNPDFWLHSKIARMGVYLGYDCFGKIKYGPDEVRVSLLRRMVQAGLGHQILIGNDLGRASYWKHYGGGPGLEWLLNKFVPRLREEGFGQEVLDDLLIHNPRRFLTGERH
ncbi:MAG: hypothetical protein NZ959_11205 [Armatimonadetes bacterium]|nr:hypothetical protein [Armatimonadota bacterium]MDW8122522.1 hypothetical protein [Armatimonadota bacterium]